VHVPKPSLACHTCHGTIMIYHSGLNLLIMACLTCITRRPVRPATELLTQQASLTSISGLCGLWSGAQPGTHGTVAGLGASRGLLADWLSPLVNSPLPVATTGLRFPALHVVLARHAVLARHVVVARHAALGMAPCMCPHGATAQAHQVPDVPH
jgi:hypothetical protein